MSIVDNLNEEQRLPVLQSDGAVLVTAGAGSGKTRLLTHRIAYLIKEKGIEPYHILAITFTNKAANEMKERIQRMVDCGDKVWVSTFHRLCVLILRRHIDFFKGFNTNFTIYADAERSRVLKEVYKQLDIDEDDDKKSIDYHIGNVKNANSTIEEYVLTLGKGHFPSMIEKAYNAYQKILKDSNALDFDDLLVFTYRLLRDNAEVREYYQEKFKYIHVDEFQDTNTIQYEIVRILAGKWGNILVVGDEDQCIYGWRGANIGNIINFKKDFKHAKVFKLEQNYRSTKNILDVANKVIDKNIQRLKKTLWTENEQGKSVNYYVANSDRDEADYVARTIRDLVASGYNYGDFAILIRLAAPSRLFEEYMLNYNLPYKMLGGFRFFERLEIKGIVGYIRAITNPRDNDSILRIINYPKRGIGDSTIEQLKQFADGGSILKVILHYNEYPFSNASAKKIDSFRQLYLDLKTKSDEMNISDFAEYLVEHAGFNSAFDPQNEEELNKLQNIAEFVNSVKEFEQNNAGSTLAEYLESITLVSDIDSVGEENDYVLISTVHAVKGLEFRTVFVSAMEEGLFPINRGGERPSDIEEERRLAYVAVTRACENLYLTRSKRRFMYKEVKNQAPSRFLKEMGFESERESRRFEWEDYAEMPSIRSKPKTTANIQTLLNSRVTAQKKDLSGYTTGTQVLHPKFGAGVITDDSSLTKNRMVTIDFGSMGRKTLSLDYAPLQIVKRK
ncbi:MAG: UvrD-helicase domain-containing protein [Clostridia bacterium]|nr:UvrD-helicase domain-containing protein [Clostridia bacterium]